MSITSEITRLQSAKNVLKTKLNNKNDELHQITNETLDEYGDFVDSIPSGGGDLEDFLYKIMSGTIDEDLEVTFPDNVEIIVSNLKTNNHNLVINGDVKITSQKHFNVGTAMISLPDTTGQYCTVYFLSDCTAKRVYCPELIEIGGSVLFNRATINYFYLPKLEVIAGNVDFSTNVANKTLYFPSVNQIGKTTYKNAFGASINYIILGTTNCSINYSDVIKGINDRNGYVFVPSNSVNTYKNATNWSAYPDIIVGYTDINANVGDTITLTGGNTYELTILWYWNTEKCATLSGNTLSLVDTGDVLIKKFDSNNICIGGEIYHISEV